MMPFRQDRSRPPIVMSIAERAQQHEKTSREFRGIHDAALGRGVHIAAGFGALILAVLVAASSGDRMNTAFFMAVCFLGPLLVRRRSILLTVQLMLIVLYFTTSAWVGPGYVDGLPARLVMMWVLAVIAASNLCPTEPRHKRLGSPGGIRIGPATIFFAFSLGIANVALAASGGFGLVGQLNGGFSSPTGLLGIVDTVAPIISAFIVTVLLLSQNRRMLIPAGLFLLQSISYSLSGFRGLVLVYIMMILTAVYVLAPRGSRIRRPKTVLTIMSVGLIVGFTFFFVGSVVRDGIARSLGMSSSGTQIIRWDNALAVLVKRLDLFSYLSAVKHETVIQLSGTSLSWSSQLTNIIPRAVWSDKAVNDYGQTVSEIYYGMPGSASSSTITWLGDIYANGGSWVVLLLGFGVGFLITRSESVWSSAATPMSIVALLCIVSATLKLEGTIILNLIQALKSFLFAGAIIWLLQEIDQLLAPLAPRQWGNAR